MFKMIAKSTNVDSIKEFIFTTSPLMLRNMMILEEEEHEIGENGNEHDRQEYFFSYERNHNYPTNSEDLMFFPEKNSWGRNGFLLLCNDETQMILEYLQPHELGLFMQCSKSLYHTVTDSSQVGERIWRKHYSRILKQEQDSSKIILSPILGYVSKLIEIGEREVLHWERCVNFDSIIQAYIKSRGFHREFSNRSVIGLVGNIGRFPSAAISRAISRRRKYAMASCIVNDMQSAVDFKRSEIGKRLAHGMASFIPIQGSLSPTTTTTVNHNRDEEMVYQKYVAELDGFIGRAIDLLELSQEYEFLRHGVLKVMVYRNITVWRNQSCLEAAMLKLAKQQEPILADLFLNPVFLEDNNPENQTLLIINHPDNDEDGNLIMPQAKVADGTCFQRPDLGMYYDAESHLAKISKSLAALKSSRAWMTYR